MLNNKTITLRIIPALVLALHSASAQGPPPSGFYQIVSGRYIVCCGIAGPTWAELPSPADAFIELNVDPSNSVAHMRFLGQDMQTVLSTPPQPCRTGFEFAFSNGVIFPDHIRFYKRRNPADPEEPHFNFGLTNSSGTISLAGTLIAGCIGTADMPFSFEHTNVVAVLMPVAAIRVSEVEVCWSSASNQTYQVQYRSAFTTNAWADLGPPIAGTGFTNCIRDQLLPGQPQRFYRVLPLP